MTGDDLVHAGCVGEESSGAAVAVNVRDLVENELGSNVDERPRIQNLGVADQINNRFEQPLSISGVAVLFRPKALRQVFHGSMVPHCRGSGLWNNGAMNRAVPALLAILLITAACSPAARMEVATNSGGLLDCPSESVVYAVYDYGADASGSPTPAVAVAIEFDAGVPQSESEGDEAVVFEVTDDDNHRVGRAMVIRLDNGWVVRWTERCG